MRDRFLGFAFAAAELLIEADGAGVVQFATGAFTRWFGVDAGDLAGRDLGSLLSHTDQATVALCLSLAGRKGRVAPVGVHLANEDRTPMALAGLCRPDNPNYIFFTLSRMPLAKETAEDVGSPEWLMDAVQNRITRGGNGTVGLIEVGGLPNQRQMSDQIAASLARAAGKNAQTRQLANGRYGVLANGPLNMDDVVGQLREFLRDLPDASYVNVRGSGIELDRNDGLTSHQVSSAMRYAFGRFADGGVEAVQKAGFAKGLTGFMTHANARARDARTSIKNGRFKLRFQPVVSLDREVVHHYEALLRPIPSEYNPGNDAQEFVSFIEAVGLAEELDLAVMTRALEAMRRAPAASVAMNISGVSAQSPGFRAVAVPLIRRAVEEFHLHPLIELTETVEITNVKEAAQTMEELRAAGALTCLDDFGAGAASYRYLRDFRVDFVKIDGGFVRSAATSARAHGMILSIAELANFVGAKVIAEMVETREQARMMRDAGIDFAQGWLFGKPGLLPGSDI